MTYPASAKGAMALMSARYEKDFMLIMYRESKTETLYAHQVYRGWEERKKSNESWQRPLLLGVGKEGKGREGRERECW
jgi:hypothetical protein